MVGLPNIVRIGKLIVYIATFLRCSQMFIDTFKARVSVPRFNLFIYYDVLMTTACLLEVYCQFVFSYFIKLGTMFAILKIPPATCSNGKTKSTFKTELIGNNSEVSRVNRNTL